MFRSKKNIYKFRLHIINVLQKKSIPFVYFFFIWKRKKKRKTKHATWVIFHIETPTWLYENASSNHISMRKVTCIRQTIPSNPNKKCRLHTRHGISWIWRAKDPIEWFESWFFDGLVIVFEKDTYIATHRYVDSLYGNEPCVRAREYHRNATKWALTICFCFRPQWKTAYCNWTTRCTGATPIGHPPSNDGHSTVQSFWIRCLPCWQYSFWRRIWFRREWIGCPCHDCNSRWWRGFSVVDDLPCKYAGGILWRESVSRRRRRRGR